MTNSLVYYQNQMQECIQCQLTLLNSNLNLKILYLKIKKT